MNPDTELLRRAAAGLPLDDFPIIDAHAHTEPGLGIATIKNSADDLVCELDTLGIRAAVFSSIPGIFGNPRYGNEAAIAGQRAYPGRLYGYMVIQPVAPEIALAEMDFAYAGGLRAMKLYSSSSVAGLPYNHPHYDPIFARADEWELPVLLHTWGRGDLDPLEPAIAKYKKIRWLLAHTGSADMDRYVGLARKYPQVNLELCFSACPRGLVEYLVREVGADRVVWGSDQMFFAAAHQLGRVVFAKISYADKCRILGGNALALMPFLTASSRG